MLPYCLDWNMMLITVTHMPTPAESLEKLKKINRPTTNDNTFHDDFQGNTYRLTDGQTSPNGKWKEVYSGHASIRTAFDNSTSGSANNYFFEQPKTSMRYNETSSCLVFTSKAISDLQMTLDMKTVRQLRQNRSPASWAWIFWHYTDRSRMNILKWYYDLLSIIPKFGFNLAKK